MTGNVDLRDLRIERGHQTLVREERRVDAPRQVSQIVQRLARLDLELPEHLLRFRRIAIDELLGEPLPHL